MSSDDKQKKKGKHVAQAAREDLVRQQRERLDKLPDPLSPENLKKLLLRVGLGGLVLWAIAIAIGHWAAYAVAGVLTVVVAGVVVWGLRLAKKSRAVTEIVKRVDDEASRKLALESLDKDFKKGDTAATFAKAQLEMQQDPKAALATLETLNLDRMMAPVADETRSQRAMLHLMLGEIDKARALADAIDLSRHKDARIRATLAAVVGESWARTGQSKRAVELLVKFDLADPEYKDLAPQLLRALAFAYAYADQLKSMREVLKKLTAINLQLVMSFITKKKHPAGVPSRGVHPALEQEAFKIVMKSGAIPRKMQIQRG